MFNRNLLVEEGSWVCGSGLGEATRRIAGLGGSRRETHGLGVLQESVHPRDHCPGLDGQDLDADQADPDPCIYW